MRGGGGLAGEQVQSFPKLVSNRCRFFFLFFFPPLRLSGTAAALAGKSAPYTAGSADCTLATPPPPPSTAAARRKQACRRSPAFPGELQPIPRRISGLPAPDGTPAQRDEPWKGSVYVLLIWLRCVGALPLCLTARTGATHRWGLRPVSPSSPASENSTV